MLNKKILLLFIAIKCETIIFSQICIKRESTFFSIRVRENLKECNQIFIKVIHCQQKKHFSEKRNKSSQQT
jgi:hypothetical protein